MITPPFQKWMPFFSQPETRQAKMSLFGRVLRSKYAQSDPAHFFVANSFRAAIYLDMVTGIRVPVNLDLIPKGQSLHLVLGV